MVGPQLSSTEDPESPAPPGVPGIACWASEAEYHGISDVDESCCNSWGTAAVVASGGTVDDTVAAAWPASAAGLVVTGAAVNGVNSVAIAAEPA